MGRYGRDTEEQSERGHIANNSHGQIQSDNINWNEDNGNIRRINTIRSVGQDEEICENQVSNNSTFHFQPPLGSGY